MTEPTELPEILSDRLRGLAERSGRFVADILREALEDGHSLRWQENFHARVEEGLRGADAGDFASEAEIDAVRNRYRPARGRSSGPVTPCAIWTRSRSFSRPAIPAPRSA